MKNNFKRQNIKAMMYFYQLVYNYLLIHCMWIQCVWIQYRGSIVCEYIVCEYNTGVPVGTPTGHEQSQYLHSSA